MEIEEDVTVSIVSLAADDGVGVRVLGMPVAVWDEGGLLPACGGCCREFCCGSGWECNDDDDDDDGAAASIDATVRIPWSNNCLSSSPSLR